MIGTPINIKIKKTPTLKEINDTSGGENSAMTTYRSDTTKNSSARRNSINAEDATQSYDAHKSKLSLEIDRSLRNHGLYIPNNQLEVKI